MSGYSINLEHLCRNQNFKPQQVVTAELVRPKGSVFNSKLIWVKVLLKNEETKFITLNLLDFYDYVQLPNSSLQGKLL